MVWAVFHRAFTFTPTEDPRSSVHYQTGHAISVRADCRKAAIERGHAKPYPAPAKGDPRVKLSANGVRYISPEDL